MYNQIKTHIFFIGLHWIAFIITAALKHAHKKCKNKKLIEIGHSREINAKSMTEFYRVFTLMINITFYVLELKFINVDVCVLK